MRLSCKIIRRGHDSLEFMGGGAGSFLLYVFICLSSHMILTSEFHFVTIFSISCFSSNVGLSNRFGAKNRALLITFLASEKV